ncbi:Protein of unknown function [Reichenbachiella faecimaris]|uniref:DUF1579 domain-containing protein n=1 Tax=Reichenbachiella faecimaris TaxID=692418 RepID=A0A1W2G7R3_REIFA|nr:DUF1579 family protein [Reichenbachiella faecimaris]SMD32368.1 Protein of unknown function [Reichenbachiella faecimaris]
MKRLLLMTCVSFMATLNLFAQNEGLKKIDFFIGEWELTTKASRPDGSVMMGKARTKAYYILDQSAIQDDFFALDANDKIVFRGTSIRSFNRQSGKYQIVWVMPGMTGITDISGVMSNGKLVTTGKGYDGNGEFLERFEYYNIEPNSYSFKMDRSYDGGKTWLVNFSSFEAKKVK